MSYCRWSEGDVYAYDSVEGGVRFCVAHGRRDLDRLCNTYNEAYQYARVLRDTHGLDVPDFAIEALKADAIEEAVRICGPNSAVSELEAENAKLREQIETLVMYVESDGTMYWVDDDGNQHFDHSAVKDENARLRALLIDAFEEFVRPYGDADDVHEYADRMSELGIEVDDA